MESQYLILRRQRMLGIAPSAEKKPLKSIPKKSTKMKVDLKEYNKIKKEMLAEDDRCELNTPVCLGQATGLHHVKRRGINMLNRKYLKRACDPCNGYLEQFPLYAIEKELSISKHSIND